MLAHPYIRKTRVNTSCQHTYPGADQSPKPQTFANDWVFPFRCVWVSRHTMMRDLPKKASDSLPAPLWAPWVQFPPSACSSGCEMNNWCRVALPARCAAEGRLKKKPFWICEAHSAPGLRIKPPLSLVTVNAFPMGLWCRNVCLPLSRFFK